MRTDLVSRALMAAVWAKRTRPGLSKSVALVRPDRVNGSARQLLGECPDGTVWGTLKKELVHHRGYETRDQARREITEYIEAFYNRQHRHSRPESHFPAAYDQQGAR